MAHSKDSRPLGPLTPYIGEWTGSGVDVVPDKNGGAVNTPFIQQVKFEQGPVLSYGKQAVHALRYSCIDWATNDTVNPATMFPVFEENGYLVWVPEQNTVMLQVSNPRGLSMMAAGEPNDDDSFSLSTESQGGTISSSYLKEFENVTGYEASLKFLSENEIHYSCNTILKLADGSRFNQTDITTLKRY